MKGWSCSSSTGPSAKLLDADLRALQVGQDGDFDAQRGGHAAQFLGAPQLVLGGAVREVQADHVGAGLDHPGEHAGFVGGGAQRGDDLGAAQGAEGGVVAHEDRSRRGRIAANVAAAASTTDGLHTNSWIAPACGSLHGYSPERP
jgi:hypothetical protein